MKFKSYFCSGESGEQSKLTPRTGGYLIASCYFLYKRFLIDSISNFIGFLVPCII